MTPERFHLETLPEIQRDVLRRVGPVATQLGFYLAGGTAVALRLGHRVSVDLDWFSPEETFDPMALSAQLKERIPDIQASDVGAGVLEATLDGVRLTFLRYRYPLLSSLEDREGVRIAALPDLVCMKIAAAVQRGEKKDFFDVVAICDGHIPLEHAMALFQRKFGLAGFGHALMALTYFDDAEQSPSPIVLWELGWPEVKSRLIAWVKQISNPQIS